MSSSPPVDTAPAAIEFDGITKRFDAFVANDRIDLTIRRGGIHAIVGENGAGKTTLMNILFGLLQPDAGSIRLDGVPVVMASPADAIAAGLGMVHQHFKLVPSLTVADNVFLGMELRRGGLIDRDAQVEATRAMSVRFGLDVDPRQKVAGLSVGVEQRIEILRVLARGARVIILDEPTAVLTPQESRELFATLRGFVERGLTVVFISHHLEEVMAVSDRLTVLRNGRHVATEASASVSKRDLVRLMVGRDVNFDRRPRSPVQGPVVLDVERLWARDDRNLPAVRDATFRVRAGEVVGIAGVAGNGQTELAEVLAGLRPASFGAARLNGIDLTRQTPGQARAAGLAHVPADRLARGVDPNGSLAANLIMGRQDKPPLSRAGLIDWAAVDHFARDLIGRFDIRARGPGDTAKRLSGGNIQKVVLAREFAGNADVLLIDQPTRGVDIGALEFIHGEIMRQREAGRAVLLLSVQLDEIRALADRILVMFNGSIMGEVDGEAADDDTIGLMMAGIAPREAAP